MRDVVADITDFISSNVGGVTKGTNLFQGPRRGPSSRFPKRSVFVTSGGGQEPTRTMQESSEHRFALINVEIRWHGFAAGNLLVRLVQDTLQAAAISGYLDVVSLQSEPVFLGEDDENNFLWSLGYELIYEEVK